MTRGALSRLALIAVLVLAAGLVARPGRATDDSFNGAHWARQTGSFTLMIGDNVGKRWRPYLKRASKQWSRSSVLNLNIVAGRANPRSCQPTTGRVEVCSARYGNTGWLGLANVWVDGSNHIVKAAVQLNDTYFDRGRYDDPVALRHTMCHEVGHTFGLDHVGTTSCLNDSQRAVFTYEKPINKDYTKLGRLYRHRDNMTTVGGAEAGGFFDPAAAPPLPSGTRGEETVRVEALGDGATLVTFITWAQPVD